MQLILDLVLITQIYNIEETPLASKSWAFCFLLVFLDFAGACFEVSATFTRNFDWLKFRLGEYKEPVDV